MTTFTRAEAFEIVHCANCGIPFAITTDFEKRRRADRKSFYCPAGHSQWFPGETDADRAQRLAGQLDMERTRRAEAQRQLDYQRRARKAVSTRLKKTKARVGRGVCPCCNRTFSALARHMASEHPGYATSEEQSDV